MDENTFGSSKAAVVLADLLGKLDKDVEGAKISRKASRAFHEYTEIMWYIYNIKDIKARKKLQLLLYKDAVSRVEEKDLPTNIRSYLLNVLNTNYKITVRLNDDMAKQEKRREDARRKTD